VQLHNPLGVLTPTLDALVVAVLARAEHAFTGRKVHQLVGTATEQGVRKALERLAEQGLVLKERVGASYTYRLSRDHLAAPHVIALANLRDELFSRWRAQFDEWRPRPTVVVLFGSAARGTMDPTSDIDLLVVVPTDAYDTVSDLVSQLEQDTSRWTGNDTRVLLVREADVSADEPALVRAASEGVIVHGDGAWLRRNIKRTRSPRGA
jgi:predicted nucleotidyltransferase